ncbi:polysaccharide pyruvyl transferase family protein [Methanobacterium formicicum]|uniref:Polysaccharide pyruvyl transferase family protein n=1 Tax=Methanobacterium formicicum TaxID=2162 RepID=A0A843AQ38_METFO|nr:polysaccharide pyruvyl transferase family protein [Methanobacterium formicicum]MBF4475250.1 polysaccharide pyruvyl transferase family protein [Methanobacterium formicicum]
MVKDDLTIALYGIKGVYNYGCEAIIRGTEIILREKWPDIHIKYVSLRPKDDKKRLKGCDVEIIPREKYPLLSLSGFSKTLAHTIGIPFYPFFEENTEWIEDCDAIFSIGGDLYTLPSNYQDKSRFHFLKYLNNPRSLSMNYGNKLFGKPYNPLIHFGDLVHTNQKKFIIWGASIGPFEKSENAKKIFRTHLLNVDLITAREPTTKSYLNNLGIHANVENCADPAFLVSSNRDNKAKISDEIVIGLNLSPFSANQVFGKNETKIILKQTEMIKKIVDKFQAKIILIPHVISENVKDDDLRYLKLLKDSLDGKTSDYVSLIDADVGFLETKKIISQCDLLIAARMHCAINAIETEVPTIFISYSKKSEGMAYYVYRNNKWIIPLDNMKYDFVLKLIQSMLSEKEYLKFFLKKRMETIRSDAYLPLIKLNQVLKK